MTQQDIAPAIDALDGRSHTLTTVLLGGWEAMVGGGPEGYILTASAEGGRRTANALSPDGAGSAEPVKVLVGGQEIEGPRGYVLSRAELDAALDDLVLGELPRKRWALAGR